MQWLKPQPLDFKSLWFIVNFFIIQIKLHIRIKHLELFHSWLIIQCWRDKASLSLSLWLLDYELGLRSLQYIKLFSLKPPLYTWTPLSLSCHSDLVLETDMAHFIFISRTSLDTGYSYHCHTRTKWMEGRDSISLGKPCCVQREHTR